jgi:alpha-D-ribose 1-methylphosphonate 5-triphosphate diphosphatase PhnM
LAFYKQFPHQITEEHKLWEIISSVLSSDYFEKSLSVACFDLEKNEELIGVTLAKDFKSSATIMKINEGSWLEGAV